MEKKWCAFLTVVFLILGEGSETAGQHAPPPPVGPPLATAAASSVSLIVVRTLIQDVTESVMEEFNRTNDRGDKLSWAAGAQPLVCDYSCMSKPTLSQTLRHHRPNERIVRASGRLVFDVDINNAPFGRRLIVGFEVRTSCEGWEDGRGNIRIAVETRPPIFEEGHDLFEDVLDRVARPFHLELSRTIDASIRGFPAGTTEVPLPPSPCRSLAAQTVGSPILDGILYDPPDRPVPGGPVVPIERATIQFLSITRHPQPTKVDPDKVLAFDLFVNSEHRGVPISGELILAPGETLVLDDVLVSLPADDLAALQVLVVDNLGGAGWAHFTRDEGFPSGGRSVQTHRTEIQPRSNLPLVPGAPAGSSKPIRLDIHEFEIAYSVRVGQPACQAPC